MDQPFVLTEILDYPIMTVWEALTNENQMRQWYFPQLKRFVPEPGFEFEFANDGSPYQKEWKVTDVVSEKRLSHSWRYKGYPGHSEVIFELSPEGNRTRLTLTHTGIESFPKDPHFARSRFESGWNTIIREILTNFLKKID